MKAIFRILGTAAAVAATGAAIVIMDKFLNEKAAPFIESIEFPEDAEQDDAEAAKTAEAYAEGEAKAEAEAIRDSIKAEMMERDTEEMTAGKYIVRWTSVLSNRFDTTAFKKAHGELYKEYTKQSASRRFSISA